MKEIPHYNICIVGYNKKYLRSFIMLKDISRQHFRILIGMGYDVQRIWDANYSAEDPDIIYLDFKQYAHLKKMYKISENESVLYDYTRYKIYAPKEKSNRREIASFTIRKPDNFDYDKFFTSVGLGIETKEKVNE